MDVNADNTLSISDVFSIFVNINGRSWPSSTPNYYLFKKSEWDVISASANNLKTSYPGLQSLTIDNLISGGTSNIYLIRSGYLD
jgi:hypothetical protein